MSDLRCDDIDAFEGVFLPLRESLGTEEKGEDNSDSMNLPLFRLPDTTVKK